MRIGELSRAAGVNPSAIRYYEQEGLIPRADRRSGRRVFDERSLDQLIVVRMAQETGFSLAEVRQLVTEFGQSRWRRLAEQKLVELEALSGRLRVMSALLTKLLECECPSIEICGRALRRDFRRRRSLRDRRREFSKPGPASNGSPPPSRTSRPPLASKRRGRKLGGPDSRDAWEAAAFPRGDARERAPTGRGSEASRKPRGRPRPACRRRAR